MCRFRGPTGVDLLTSGVNVGTYKVNLRSMENPSIVYQVKGCAPLPDGIKTSYNIVEPALEPDLFCSQLCHRENLQKQGSKIDKKSN